MKEIDKIRIRQWNQDNPYIQMKNLENAQPGYRVHTVNDDHHLYELPLETQNIILCKNAEVTAVPFHIIFAFYCNRIGLSRNLRTVLLIKSYVYLR